MVDLNEDKWLLIGRIVGAHGLDGYVKVKPESDFPERFEDRKSTRLNSSHPV